MIDGKMTHKDSDAAQGRRDGRHRGRHPFKDTSGSSMNILIKLTCLVGLTIAPILGEYAADNHEGMDSPKME